MSACDPVHRWKRMDYQVILQVRTTGQKRYFSGSSCRYLAFISSGKVCCDTNWFWVSFTRVYVYLKKTRETDTVTERHWFIARNWLIQLWELVSLKSVGQAGSRSSQARVDAVVLRQISFLGSFSSCLKSLSTDWRNPTDIVEGNFLYFKSTDCRYLTTSIDHLPRNTHMSVWLNNWVR